VKTLPIFLRTTGRRITLIGGAVRRAERFCLALPALRDLAALAGGLRGGAASPVGPAGARAGFVSLVGAGPGSCDLITLRGVQRLQEADAILYDRLVDPDTLEFARRDAERIFVGKTPGTTAWPQHRIDALMVATARQGKRIVRLKCGDPGIFGRGAEEAAALNAAGIAWEIVPGVTAAAAASAALGGFLTERGVTDTLVITTGQTRAGDPAPDWVDRLRPGTTLALYMGIANASTVERSLLAAGNHPGLPVDIVSRAASRDQRTAACTLGTLSGTIRAQALENPAVILIRCPKTALGQRRQTPVRLGNARAAAV
jgi:uroporphyrin-III C-methyltransferase/precorrin-2 dehydrogenase/sirohydrochlorin ferrochelatase